MIDTWARRDLTDGRYAARRRSCKTAVRKLGAGSLRDVPDQPTKTTRLGDPVLQRRARHVRTETAV